MSLSAHHLKQRLQLEPHPEGGFYRQTYRAELELASLPAPFTDSPRPAATDIYFLLEGADFSAFHRLHSDELWHFYAGSRLVVYIIQPDGALFELLLGGNCDAGETFQGVVKAGCWFASRLATPEGFALVGCTVAPGFDFEDFELAERDALSAEYPQHTQLITSLTRTPREVSL